MKIAVVGYGRMGHEVEAVCRERGHEPACIDLGAAFPQGSTVAIDFTDASAVEANVKAALESGARVVVGTTGWTSQLERIRALVEQHQGGLVHAPNFSLGVNLFYRIARHASALMALFPDYDPYIVEKHHRMKKDFPSGTANALAQIVAEGQAQIGAAQKKPQHTLDGLLPAERFHVASVRAGGIVGEHVVGFDSGGDEILIEHRARSRRGLALGAVLAAEWIATRRGFYSFDTMLDELLTRGPAS